MAPADHFATNLLNFTVMDITNVNGKGHVCVPRIAQINIALCKFHFFYYEIWVRRGMGGVGGGSPPLLRWLSAVLIHRPPPPPPKGPNPPIVLFQVV